MNKKFGPFPFIFFTAKNVKPFTIKMVGPPPKTIGIHKKKFKSPIPFFFFFMAMLTLSAAVERFSVSRARDFLN